MSSSMPAYYGRKLILCARNFVANNPKHDITFDTVFIGAGETYPLGENLHRLFTTEYTLADDIKLQLSLADKLNAAGITYEILLENTLRTRGDKAIPNQPTNVLEILPKAPIFSEPTVVAITPDDRRVHAGALGEPVVIIPEDAGDRIQPKPKNSTRSTGPKKPASKNKPGTVKKEQPTKPSPTASESEVTLESARRSYENWYMQGGPGGISYALRNCAAYAKENSGKVPENISVGTVSAKGKHFLSVLRTLQISGDLGSPGLAPSGILKDRIDARIRDRQEGAARASQFR